MVLVPNSSFSKEIEFKINFKEFRISVSLLFGLKIKTNHIWLFYLFCIIPVLILRYLLVSCYFKMLCGTIVQLTINIFFYFFFFIIK